MFKKNLSQSDYLVIAANLVPVYGVLFLEWNAKEVFLVYCLETIIVGIFTLLKLGITGAIKKRDVWNTQNGKTIYMPVISFMLFFIVHYGMFVAIQMGMFFEVSSIGKNSGIGFFNFFYRWPELITREIYIMLGVFIVSYAFRNITEFILSGEYRTASLGLLMFQPYGRIFVQQVTVILGSMFLAFGGGKVFIVIFALIKIFFEVFVNYEAIIRKSVRDLASGKQ
jgi:hypothetical protein